MALQEIADGAKKSVLNAAKDIAGKAKDGLEKTADTVKEGSEESMSDKDKSPIESYKKGKEKSKELESIGGDAIKATKGIEDGDGVSVVTAIAEAGRKFVSNSLKVAGKVGKLGKTSIAEAVKDAVGEMSKDER